MRICARPANHKKYGLIWTSVDDDFALHTAAMLAAARAERGARGEDLLRTTFLVAEGDYCIKFDDVQYLLFCTWGDG